MNRVAVRLQRKIRRNVGSSPRTKLELVAFETGAVYQYYRNGLVYKIVPHEHGFTEVNEGELFVRGSLTLERFNRLFPKSRIGVVPNTPKEKT
jgi:hypothetical protein